MERNLLYKEVSNILFDSELAIKYSAIITEKSYLREDLKNNRKKYKKADLYFRNGDLIQVQDEDTDAKGEKWVLAKGKAYYSNNKKYKDIIEGWIKKAWLFDNQILQLSDPVDNPKIAWHNSKKENSNRFKSIRSGNIHQGIDIAATIDTPLKSITSGVVVAIIDSFKPNEYKKKSYGNTVEIQTLDVNQKSLFLFYGHLNKIYVTPNQPVTSGDIIGLTGSTGNAASPDVTVKHVHIETSWKQGRNDKINPELFIPTKFDSNGEVIVV
jgi:murein DD-endopeptidase MepM/ murein hydrolase activator NlpD